MTRDLSFATSGPVDADEVYRRMVFSDITPDSYHWRWESSPDGDTWTVDLEFDYRRRPERIDA